MKAFTVFCIVINIAGAYTSAVTGHPVFMVVNALLAVINFNFLLSNTVK